MRSYAESDRYYKLSASIPGHSLTRSKAPGKLAPIGEGPLYASWGDGDLICDVDGNTYIDMVCALGAISLGYRVRVYGGVLSLPSWAEQEAANAVLKQVAPWATSVRFTKTGSEATHAAQLVAKAATGHHHIWMGDWAYHGWHEWTRYTTKFRHGQDMNEVLAGSDAYPAAVFIEPHRWEATDPAWLRHVRDFCTRAGALLVFDEMIYGLRMAMGGGSQLYGIEPDLACYGKALGNGTAIACVVGGEPLATHGEMVSGTYSGDESALRAVAHTLDTYHSFPVLGCIEARGRQLQQGLQKLVEGRQDVFAEGAHPQHQRLRFVAPERGKAFSAAMATRGVLWHPEVVNICYAHTEEHIGMVLDMAKESLAAV